MPVSDLDAALAFYTQMLGFEMTFKNEGAFAIIARDGVEIGLAPAEIHHGIPGKSNVYLKVSEIESFYADLQSRGAQILHPLKKEPYHMKEFMIADIDGNTINYGDPY